MRNVTLALIAILLTVGVLVGVGVFTLEVDADSPGPVEFNDTVLMGVSFDDEISDPDVDLPRTQVFYSQYRYVVGYHGAEWFVNAQRQEGHEQRFGYPLAVYVTDYSGTDLELSDEGYPRPDGEVTWTDAELAWFVVDSDARTPDGETVVPFSSRDDAETYTADYGGSVVSWDTLLEYEFDLDDAAAVGKRVDERQADADRLVEQRRTVADRPVETVVGENETIQEAISRTPTNATVLVPEGTYDELIEVDRPVTLQGEGDVSIRGDGESTVMTIRSPDAAVRNFEITDVGNSTSPEEQASVTENGTEDGDAVLEMAYAGGDAGVYVDDAPRVLVEDVSIETPSNGVMLRDSPETVVRNVSVKGGDEWGDAYMGVMSMRSGDSVIEESTFRDGRDGIYTHRSHGVVFRNNTLEGNRIGVHFMYTGESVIADNVVRDAEATGIHVMTNPHQNAVVGNDVRDSPTGIRTEGWNSYVARNVVVDTDLGMTTEAGNSIYEHNVLVRNEIGMRASHFLPANRVLANDFVDNDLHTQARQGTLRIWTHDGVGNYWHGAVGDVTDRTADDGEVVVFDRPYSATDTIDSRLHRVGGTPALAHAPQFDELAAFEGTVSGMRDASVVDTAPRCEPANPDLLAAAGLEPAEYVCGASTS
ncbi:NosD domain-containing protein [Natronolimnohabitans innermongolicus]|uniref:NosL family protein n=1 Tax=Natronolimnohabitans innermongolicus JCM 12255 TaxID=1227499 RepID=L9WNG3_9EURY|nr:NosD domain-containing protein [Natronolimnohabitans innermongolicus]ELY51005.1 NosL family protein [Natronolimnohabitans innermongolicus JCM 12255]